MTADADTIREALREMSYHPKANAALAALARLEACETQLVEMTNRRDGVAFQLEAERHVHRKDNEYLLAQRDALVEALGQARRLHDEQLRAIDDGDNFGEHVGLVRHRRAVANGMEAILAIYEDAAPAEAAPKEAGQ